MTQEEKAQRYDKAIKRANSLLSDNQLGNAWIYKLLPELAESEDKRIKSDIQYAVRCTYGDQSEQTNKILAWVEAQGEHAKFRDSIQVGDKVTRNQDGVLVNLSQLKRVAKPAEEYNIRGIGSKNAQGKLGEMIKNLKSADKVEPKFKVGDWIIRSAENFEHNKYLITEIRDYYTCKDLKDRRVTFTFNDVHKNFKLWDISDAKDGDVLACESGWTCIFKKLNHNSFGGILFDSYCFIDRTGWFCDGAKGHTLDERINGKIYPATKEQRDLLFQKMKEAGYEWDTKKKELKKIKQKHFCELNNLCACIKFPFKAKVKSSGKIVTIHDGQLSYDGKEWIKYQSDAKDGYKVYEPNNLLESVCEIEQNSAWSEEDEDILKQCLYFFNGGKGGISDNRRDEILNWFKSLKERVQPQPKQEWSDEDKKTIHLACEFIRHHSSLIDSIGGIDCTTLIDRLKSLRPQSTWKPSDEQMKALYNALSLAKNCGKEIAFDLRTLHEQLKKLKEK